MIMSLQRNIRNLNVTRNNDAPESVFDALMQVSVCTEVISCPHYFG